MLLSMYSTIYNHSCMAALCYVLSRLYPTYTCHFLTCYTSDSHGYSQSCSVYSICVMYSLTKNTLPTFTAMFVLTTLHRRNDTLHNRNYTLHKRNVTLVSLRKTDSGSVLHTYFTYLYNHITRGHDRRNFRYSLSQTYVAGSLAWEGNCQKFFTSPRLPEPGILVHVFVCRNIHTLYLSGQA